MVELKEPFKTLWQGKDPFHEIEQLTGHVYRALETRKTLRFEIDNIGYFIKIHYGTTTKEVVKNLLSFRLPVLGADREWKAIHRLAEVGVDTMHGVAFGMKGTNPVTITSFIITEELTDTISLEDYCAQWKSQPPGHKAKRKLISHLATMVKKMHAAGVNHRDCYLCHFLLHLPYDPSSDAPKLSVIDLHRAQIRPAVPLRWRNKDLIGLYFSSLDIGLTTADVFYFMKVYFGRPLRDILRDEHSLIASAQVRAQKIKERTLRKGL